MRLAPSPGRRHRPSRIPRVGLVAGLVLLAVLAAAGPASAHATLISSDPAEGEVLAAVPDAVTFTFDEPVTLSSGGVQVFDAAGAPVDSASVSRDTTVTVDLPATLDDGTYVVTWRAVSADGHPVAGSLSFSIGSPSLTVAAPEVAPDEVEPVRTLLGITQALAYVGLLLAGGLVFFFAWTAAGVRLDPRLQTRLRRVLAAAAGLAVVAGLVGLPLTAAYQQGVGLGSIAGALDLGLLADDLVVLGLQVLGLALAVVLLHRRRVALIGATVAVLAPALVGHSRSIDPAWLLVVTDGLHLAAGATWFGGLVGLALVLPSLSGRSRDAAVVLTRFSTLAGGLLAVLALSGVLMGFRILGTWSALIGTDYGRLLLVKVGLAAIVASVAAWNRWRLLPAVTRGVGHTARRGASLAVARAVRLEAVLLVVLLGVTGFLVNRSPREVPPERPAVASRVEAGVLGENRALATLTPGTRGANTLVVQVQSADGEPVDGFSAPMVAVRSATGDLDLGAQPVVPTAVGTYAAELVLPAPGTWLVQVSLRTSEFDNPVTTIRFEVP